MLDRDGRVVGVNTNRVQEGFYQAIAATEEVILILHDTTEFSYHRADRFVSRTSVPVI